MRTVPEQLTPELQKVLTKSTFLIWFQTVSASGHNPTDYRLSTGGEVAWGGYTWLATGARMRHPIELDRVSFSMTNQTGAMLSLASIGALRRAPVKIWAMYPDTSVSADAAVLFMRGVVSRVSNLFEDRAILTVERYADENQVVPTTIIAPPTWMKLPPRNLELQWGSRKIALFRPEVG